MSHVCNRVLGPSKSPMFNVYKKEATAWTSPTHYTCLPKMMYEETALRSPNMMLSTLSKKRKFGSPTKLEWDAGNKCKNISSASIIANKMILPDKFEDQWRT